jgi:diaminohydroxyphosphoribosylaminopyrimidine deaminase / 5-amino-6-(5-phosphoribosylamino)uracil reductase
MKFMERAIALGELGRITAPPNPWVGCVIVKEGRIVGEGYHVRAGEPHAEVIALRQAGAQAEGATVYTTLEPCCHFGRTPPCTNALIAAKISHAVVAVPDPDPHVSGRGMNALKEAGIKVTHMLEELATQSLEPYLHQRRTGLPFVVAKAAISLDGRTAASDGSSQWISSESARRDAHRLRAESQAIMIGSGTARRDNPRLNVRDITPLPPTPPLRIVLNTRGDLPCDGPLFDPSLGKTILFTAAPMDAPCEVIPVSKTPEGVNVKEVLQHLGKQGILQVMVEGGAILLGNLLKESLINRLVIYMGSCILGERGKPLFDAVEIPNIRSAPKLKLLDVTKFDDTLRMRYQHILNNNKPLN